MGRKAVPGGSEAEQREEHGRDHGRGAWGGVPGGRIRVDLVEGALGLGVSTWVVGEANG